jgi:hypothetical protein
MTIEEIKQQITALAKKHQAVDSDMSAIDDIKDAELIEQEAIDIIVSYCEDNGYLINGFPTEKRKLLEEEGEDEEDYFCQERFLLYLDTLALEKKDVADIWWFFNQSFWPDLEETKAEFLERIEDQIASGFYDVEL